ncbi:hypothetical protein [Gorillibacterium massiliense]|uniref:hypothetical protein n=1 Tax=Gorillibacterium massiliense TaxID=1280390 RepID=UPI0004B9AC2A|nr:hypothetical protein [Gorillibacterium massiliense]
MRTEDQVKRKIIELKHALAFAEGKAGAEAIASQILILEWVLDNPMQSYHA